MTPATKANIGMVIFICALCVFMFLAEAKAQPTSSPETQVFMSIVLLVFGYIYYRFREAASKVVLGLFAIAAGVISNWFELGKLLAAGSDRYERAIFVGVGLAVIAHGFKQLKLAQAGNDVD